MELDSINRDLWNDKCDYIDVSDCPNLNPNGHNFIILQYNIQSLLAHQEALRRLLNNLQNKNSRVDIVLLSETHLNSQTVKFVNIPGYQHVANYRTNYKGGGTSILIHESIPYRKRKDLEVFDEKLVESTYVEITGKNKKKYVVGSLYRSPNTDESPLINHLSNTINRIKAEHNNKEIIMGMDHNMDLIKSQHHTATGQFLDMMLKNCMLPTITRPSRITRNSATLIDNVFISEHLQKRFDSCLLIDDTTDHLPALVLLRQTRVSDKKPLIFNSRRLNETKMQKIKENLQLVDWNGLLNSDDCNENFN